MALLEVNNLKFRYTDKELYNDASFRILPSEHIVLVGPNGSGKSTFLNIISKNIIPDTGKIEWLNNIKYDYLDQQLKVKQDITIYNYLYDVFMDLYAKEKEMNDYFNMLGTAHESDYEKYLNRALLIQDELEKKNFYALNSTVGNITNGLGIVNYGMQTKLNKLSGGQRAKVYLAKLLLDKPDVLLMDEPTNFLDAEHVDWLAKYLISFSGAFVVISHDESFLRQIGEVVYSLENKVLVRYKGNYDFYLKEKELRTEQYEKEYIAQQKHIKKTEAFIQKNIVSATSTKQAQSKRTQLEKLVKLEKPTTEAKISIKFPFSRGLGQEVLKFINLEVGYNKPLLPPLNYLIKQNQKVAILGKNGIGKTTILKTILGLLNPISGSFVFNPSADINYFSQEDENFLEDTPINFIRNFYPLMTDGEIRSVLAKTGLKSEHVTKKMKELSGGEKTKARLALMTLKKSNILIFDEPTNHLDVKAKEVLYKAISDFPGSVILVSHERDFYDGLVDFEINF